MSNKKKVDVLIVRAPEHNYEYLQWTEDINASYLLSVFKEHGINTEIYDFALRSSNGDIDAVLLIENFAPKVVIWVMDKHPTNNPFHVSENIKSYASSLVGPKPHLTIYGNTQVGPTRFLEELPVDTIILGEEYDALSLVRGVLAKEHVSTASGIAYRSDEGIITTPASPRPVLDALPWPTRYFFDHESGSGSPTDYVGAVQASRGCYGKCSFCFLRTKELTHGGYEWQSRNPVDIADELELLYRKYGVREFAFVDTQFFGPGKRGQDAAIALGIEISSRRMEGVSFSIYARANDIEEKSLRVLKDAGLYAVFIGIESFSQSVLDRYNKGASVEQNLKSINLLFKYDIHLRMGFITFDHQTTFEEIEESTLELQRLCNIRGDLITQPVFFNNALTPLENTPAGRDYANFQVPYDLNEMLLAAPRLYSYRSKLSRGASYAINKDIRVEILAEGIRMLAAEITQRSTLLEGELARTMSSTEFSSVDNSYCQASKAMDWFCGLTLFTVNCISEMIGELRNLDLLHIEDSLDEISSWVVSKCRDYDMLHFSQEMLPDSAPRYVSID